MINALKNMVSQVFYTNASSQTALIKQNSTYNPFEKQARFYENIDTVSREDIYNDIKYNLLVKI